MVRHVFFDLDSTLTPSRASMLPEHQPLFERLCKEKDVIVVTGGKIEQIRTQIPLAPTGNYWMLSQQGNHAIDKTGTLLWHEKISPEQEEAVRTLALRMTDEFATAEGITIPDHNDIFEDRGSQLASSVLGFHAPNEQKYAADPDQTKRQELLARHADDLARLRTLGIEAMPAGTTTIDFILLGKNKGYNIERLIAHEGWQKDECLYIGDALFPKGNDESVIGIIPTHPIKDHNETFAFIDQDLL